MEEHTVVLQKPDSEYARNSSPAAGSADDVI